MKTRSADQKAKGAKQRRLSGGQEENTSVLVKSPQATLQSPKANRQPQHRPQLHVDSDKPTVEQGDKSLPASRKLLDNGRQGRDRSPRKSISEEKNSYKQVTPKKHTSDGAKESRHMKRLHRVRFYEYEPLAINCLACNEENNTFALSRSDGSIELWRFIVGDEREISQFAVIPADGDSSIEALLWHNNILYKAGLDGDLVEYNMETLQPAKRISGHSGAIWCLQLNPTKDMIAAGTEDGCVVLFDYTGDGFRYFKSLQKQEERILSLDWYSDGEVIVTGGVDVIRLWSVETGQALLRITIARQSADKQTIVWAVKILKDKTIVSGDSRGKVTFWNGHHGTQIKMFGCHRADILSLCVNADENKVYAAGIDPTLVQLELAPVSSSSDWLVWHQAGIRIHHTHDVRALNMMNGCIISAGVDCSIVAVDFEKKMKMKTLPLPQNQKCADVAKEARLVLLRYSDKLQVWSLGETNTNSSNGSASKPEQGSQILPLSMNPFNLLELRSRNEEQIVSSAISSNGSWIAYSDRQQLRLFSMKLKVNPLSVPSVSACRVKALPETLSHKPVVRMKFHEDKLVLGYTDGSVKCAYLNSRAPVPCVDSVTVSPALSGISFGVLSGLEVSSDGRFIAVTGSACYTCVYALSSQGGIKIKCQLPHRDSLVTAMCFSPDNEKLAVAYSSLRSVYEFSLSKQQFIGVNENSFVQSRVSQVQSPISTVSYSLHDSKLILVQDPHGVRVYDSEKGQISKTQNLLQYKYLMYFEEVSADEYLIIERSPLSLNALLPNMLSKNKFGI